MRFSDLKDEYAMYTLDRKFQKSNDAGLRVIEKLKSIMRHLLRYFRQINWTQIN